MRLAFLIVLLSASICFGQVSSEEAQANLQKRQAERAAAAAKPANLTQGQVDQLMAQITSLKTQVAQLKTDNDALRKKLAAKDATTMPVASAAPPVPPAAPAHSRPVWVGQSEADFEAATMAAGRNGPAWNYASLVQETKGSKTYQVNLQWGKINTVEGHGFSEHGWRGTVTIEGGEVTAMTGNDL